MFDVLFKNARIVDGTGNSWYRGDVGVAGDRIAAIGLLGEAEAGRTIDCGGQILSPGFIDMHTHSDVMLLAEPLHEGKVYQGVTLDLLGQDGLSYAPVSPATLQMFRRHIGALNGNPDIDWSWTTVASFMERFDRKVSVNTAYLVPHCAVRAEVLGMEDRLPSPAELDRMCGLLDEGMADGAVGFSTGLDYTPHYWSDTNELVQLCKVAARRNGLFVTHVRYELGDGFLDPMREAIDIGKLSGVKVHISHLRGDRLGKPDTNPDRLFALFEQARADGVDLTYDSYAYPRGSSLLHRLLPGWSHVGGPDKILERLQNPADRERVKEHLRGLTIDWSNVTIGGVLSKQSQRLEGWSIAEAAGEMGVDVADYVCDILVETNLGVQYLSDPSSSEESIERVLAHPLATSGSDGLCWGSARHPRTYGSFARVLGRYVRERKVMPLEDAVRKMTGACAARLALKDRGLIREGYAADIAVWDDATIIDNSTYEKPLQTASGVSYVLVNGTFTLDQGAHTGATAGRALKPLIE